VATDEEGDGCAGGGVPGSARCTSDGSLRSRARRAFGATALREFFACLNQPRYPPRPSHIHATAAKDHGRFETRRCTAVDDLAWRDALELRQGWPNRRSGACIESQREWRGQIQAEARYVISSLPADAEHILYGARSHWGAENGLHWCWR
jgi:hypothetical protein